jgi:gliding motility-associated-like protein
MQVCSSTIFGLLWNFKFFLMCHKRTKLLTVLIILMLLLTERSYSQCALITDNYSGQIPSSVCAPVNMTMDVRYKFLLPVNPSRVEILYVWNDGTGATTLVPAISQGDTIFTATATHNYLPSDECSYTAEAYVIYDGEKCSSSSRQEQTFSAWARDNENGGVIITDPVVAQFCEGEDIADVIFSDNSTFNCNVSVEPDKPNRIIRWVQFIYGTSTIAGNRIPNVTVEDGLGNTYQLTDADGNPLGTVSGPIVEVPIPADGPNQSSWAISAPPGGEAGDIFEITMRNWNICNAYDNNPFDSNPPADIIDGDNPPITTTALIEIITTPPEIANPSLEFCTGSPVNLSLSTSGGEVRWFADSLLVTLIHTGSSFDPTGPPTYIDNSVSGRYSYWVTERLGICESAPSKITFEIFDTPVPPADAGNDTIICGSTFQLNAANPFIGSGSWTTSGGAIIDDPADPATAVINLDYGTNLFIWTVENGPCVSVDDVTVTRDMQPDAADAGSDQSFCDDLSSVLNASAPTNNGTGEWDIIGGSLLFTDNDDPHSGITNIGAGENIVVWTVRSQFGACLTTSDTAVILRDVTPNMADAGADRGVCDSAAVFLDGNTVSGGGTGLWSVLSGGAAITNPGIASSEVTGLSYGINQFLWEITSRFGICSGSSDAVNITRDEAPDPAYAGADQDLCSTLSMPLGANAATVGAGVWSVVTNPSGTAPAFNPSIDDENATVQILPGNEGIYGFSWTITNESCITSDTVIIDFGMPAPPADAGVNDSVCGITAGLNSNTPSIGTGTWSRISGPGDVTFLPSSHSPTALARITTGNEGLYEFEWRIISGSCPSTADTVSVLYKPLPGMPSANGTERCGAASVTLTSTIGLNGNSNRWYETGFGGTIISTSENFTTPVLNSATSYWVATYNDTTYCESYRRRVDVIINPVPEVPAVSDMEHCGEGPLLITAAIGNNGTTNRWYDAATGGNMLSVSRDFTTPYLTGSTSYWVSSYNELTTCESERIRVDITIYPVPGLPVVNDESICGQGTLTLTSYVGLDGTTNNWYDSQVNGNLLDTGTIFTTPYLANTVSYWVSTYNSITGCESGRIEVRAVINPVPSFPTADDVYHCGPDSLVLTSSAGVNGTVNRWYDSITGGSMLEETNVFTTPWLTDTRSYYVSSYNDITGCTSSRIQVQAVILPTPGINLLQGAGEVGQGQSNVIYSVNYHAGSTYDWVIPPGITLLLENQNFVILQFPNLGLYNISVTETNSIGCPGPESTKQVNVREDLLYVNLNVINGQICAGEHFQITATPSGGTPSYAFQWSGDTEYLSATNISNPVFVSSSAGIYRLRVNVTDINFNSASDSLTLTVNPNPQTIINNNDTIVCAGENMQLNTAVSGGSGNYDTFEWSGQTIPLSGTDIRNPVFNTIVRGSYFLRFTVVDNKGCRASDSINIISDVPAAAFISDAAPACSPVTINFHNQSDDAVSCTWDFGDGATSNIDNPSHEFRNVSTSVNYFNVRLTAYSQYGCSHTANEYVTVYPNPETSIDAIPVKACHPADILLIATPGGFTYNWNYGDEGQEEAGYNTMRTYYNNSVTDTVYHVQLITTSFFNCLDTSFVDITVYPSPAASFAASPQQQMYPDKTVSFVNTTEDRNWDYKWYFGDGTTTYDRQPGSHDYPGVDNYTISLVVSGEHCSDSVSADIEIIPHPPVAKFKPVEPGCMPLTIHFENTSSFSSSFLWEFGDGAVSNKPNPVYTYYEPGQYKIKLTARGDGGEDTYQAINDVYILPNSYFNLAPRYVYVNDEAVHYFNLSDNGDVFEWDFGDGTTSTELSPKHVYTEEGVYDVTLCVWTDNDCFDLYVMENAVYVEPSGKLVYPNAFRPESMLEENRVFKPAIIDQVDTYHLMIFNRWGALIFESYNKDMGWDGRIGGKLAKQDVYIWKVEGKYTNGENFVDSGDVTLLR